jgi:hypothetical protein
MITIGFIIISLFIIYGIYYSVKEMITNHKEYINQLKSEKNE